MNKVKRKCIEFALKCLAGVNLCINKKKIKHRSGNIKVGFICQYIPAWNKFESIYREILKRNDMEAVILCVPLNIKEIDQNSQNDTFEYFMANGYDAVNTLLQNGEWLDLRSLDLDYLFYTRPYNMYLPTEYRSNITSKYVKICNLPYAMNMTKDIYDITLNVEFFKDVSIFFAETEYSKKMFEKRFPLTTAVGIRAVKFLGMPAMEQIMRDKDKKTNIWDFHNGSLRILWTPRWTTSPEVGGSNFFVYYQELLKYARSHSDISLLCRPHPLMFENFQRTGEMTEQEIDDYISEIETEENVSLDETKEYDSTLWSADVMVSDISGIMPEFFVTGKPLIYCASNMVLEVADHTKEMLEGCYVANNKEEMFDYLEQLRMGKDPLKEKRNEIIQSFFGPNIIGCSKAIVDEIVQDFMKE